MTPPTKGIEGARCEFCPSLVGMEHLQAEIERVDGERRSNESKLFERMDAFAQRLSHLEGRIVGYLLAGSFLTAALVFLAQKVFAKGG